MRITLIGVLLAIVLISVAAPKQTVAYIQTSKSDKAVEPAARTKKVKAKAQESKPAVNKRTVKKEVAKPAPKPEPKPPLTPQQKLLREAGIARPDWPEASHIFFKESSWRPAVINEIGCKGLGQSCPNGSGLVADCPDWRNNPVCQIKHFDAYAERRYGGWSGAFAFWTANHWW